MSASFKRWPRTGGWNLRVHGLFIAWHAGIRGLYAFHRHSLGRWSLVIWRLEIAWTQKDQHHE
jgi:hypothetical protein